MTAESMAPPSTKSQVLRSFNVADFPALRGLEEEWRFTPLKRLGELVTASALSGTAPAVEHGELPPGVSIKEVDEVDPIRLGMIRRGSEPLARPCRVPEPVRGCGGRAGVKATPGRIDASAICP